MESQIKSKGFEKRNGPRADQWEGVQPGFLIFRTTRGEEDDRKEPENLENCLPSETRAVSIHRINSYRLCASNSPQPGKKRE